MLRSDGVEALAITGSDATRAAPLTYGGSKLRGAGRGTTQRSMASGEAARYASSCLDSRLLIPERTRGRPGLLEVDKTRVVGKNFDIRAALLHLCSITPVHWQPFVAC